MYLSFPRELTGTATFRLAATLSLAFLAAALAIFAFIYWQTALYETHRIDTFLREEAAKLAGQSEAEILARVQDRIASDFHRVTFAGLFDVTGHRLAGNLAVVPAGLRTDGMAHPMTQLVYTDNLPSDQNVRVVGVRLADGDTLVIGRNVDELRQLRETVIRALGLGLFPVVFLSITAGAWLSLRTLRHIKQMNAAIEQIMRGDIHERIPVRGTTDDLDRLTVSVNFMLDELERLMREVKGVGDDIAHDLRTPLTRMRIRLERAGATARTEPELRGVIDRALVDLDQTFAIITALLRIGEIESGRRRGGFGQVNLAAIGQQVANLYQPLAELKEVELRVEIAGDSVVLGDRDLLMEAAANLVDNAIKFVGDRGRVTITAESSPREARLIIADNGPGISADERDAVVRRFYRADRSRHVQGNGLGLSLVLAITRLHGFTLEIGDAVPGCVVSIIAPQAVA